MEEYPGSDQNQKSLLFREGVYIIYGSDGKSGCRYTVYQDVLIIRRLVLEIPPIHLLMENRPRVYPDPVFTVVRIQHADLIMAWQRSKRSLTSRQANFFVRSRVKSEFEARNLFWYYSHLYLSGLTAFPES
nr:hypothetical protein CFP56_00583 [Quercus suber]